MSEYGRSPERSIVTLVAFDTVGSTEKIADLDPDDAQVFLDKILAYIRQKVESAGGIVGSFHGDGGFGIFGWPHSLEDHADRACEAAWYIQHPRNPGEFPLTVHGEPVEFRVGVHSGLVGFRQLQTGVGSNLDLVGANVHQAAALQKAAPSNGIVISNDAKALCKNGLALKEYDSEDLKHVNGGPFHLLCAAPKQSWLGDIASRYPFPMVGRENERRQIDAALAPVPTRPSSAAILGEPGIGKSRLASAIAESWIDDGKNVFLFTGNARRQTTPFTLAKTLILTALNLDFEAGEDQILHALSIAGIPQTHIAELGASVFRLSDAPEPQTRAQTTKQVATRLVQTFSALTTETKPHLLIEDIHLIDPESLDCLAMIASGRDCSHMVTLMTGRPEAGAILSGIARTVIHLQPMRVQEMAALASKFSGKPPANKQLLEETLRQADGVPFVLEQLLMSSQLQSRKSKADLPQTVESLIHGRLNMLSKRAKSVVQTISVVGDEIELDVAMNLLDTDIDKLQPCVNELSRFGLLRGEVSNTLRFQHSIITAACLNTVPKLKRKAVHKAAVDAIMAAYPQTDSQFERLAFHAEGAGDLEMALDYLWLAGLQARRSAASASLLKIFKRAMACIEEVGKPGNERYVNFVLLACAALLQIGEFEEMKRDVPVALKIARELDDPDKVCGVLTQLAMLQWFEGNYREALNTCSEALTLAERLKSPPLIFAAEIMNASVLHGLGNVNEAIKLQKALCDRLTAELASARLGAPAVPSSMALAFLGWFMVEVGNYSEAQRHADRALKVAERYRDPYAEVLARNAQGRILLRQNRAEDAMRTMLAAKRICDSEGFDAINPHVTGRLAAAMARSGSTEMAVKVAGELADKTNGERTGYLEMFNFRLGYGEALVRNGQHDQGFEQVNAAISMAEQIDSPCLKVQALSIRIVLLEMAGAKNAQAQSDRRQRQQLCEASGLVAWEPKTERVAQS